MKSINFRFKSAHEVVKKSNYISKVINSDCDSVFISRRMASCITWSPSPEYQYLHFSCCHSFRLTRKKKEIHDFKINPDYDDLDSYPSENFLWRIKPYSLSGCLYDDEVTEHDICDDCLFPYRCMGEVVDNG